MKILLTFILTICLVTNFPHAFSNSAIYRWTDENGKVHFGDKKNADAASSADKEQLVVNSTKPRWKPFEIQINQHNTNFSEEELSVIQTGVIHVYQFFDKVMHFDMYKTVPVRIEVFSDKYAYANYLKNIIGDGYQRSLGIYLPKTHTIALYIQKNRARTLATARHEVSHAILHSISQYTPRWLNEGLAEQMETLEGNAQKLTISRHKGNHRYVKKNAQSMKIATFIDLSSKEWHRANHATDFVHQSFSGELVYFLLSSKNGRAFISRLLHEYQRGSTVRSRHLVSKHYIGNMGGLETAWKSWFFSEGKDKIVLRLP